LHGGPVGFTAHDDGDWCLGGFGFHEWRVSLDFLCVAT
jgi:hypothetical protein